jgi:hypothetical protein
MDLFIAASFNFKNFHQGTYPLPSVLTDGFKGSKTTGGFSPIFYHDKFGK